ncbi:uncharacterized protein J4E84_008398 [Alternaria hordeiaustralica]|uniref:uncharacterized protein n=1 Tax=Alternaria hordeiaustralica TaxID=1187925 RepID=UPI0020C3BC04|nr:uncharacterized protein J4E84_008398 [Alternaria hordeiaustralica]KAI4679368.1 hypothetical protein J4E84_008398 [Alternaria hordeiaustralica]
MSVSALPTELLSMIFDEIRRKEDMQAVSLVCHKWRVNLAPLMWYTLNTDLLLSKSQSMKALVNSQSLILPHIRRIIIATPRRVAGDSFEMDQIEHKLRLLLTSLPRDRITHFMASTLRPSRHTIHMLLKSQRKLEELNVRIRSDEAFTGKGPLPLHTAGPSMEPPLKDLTGLAVYVHCHPKIAKNSFEYYRKLLTYVPKLRTLSLAGTFDEYRPFDQLNLLHILQPDVRELTLTSLTTLLLKHIDLGISHKPIFSNIEFANLRTLSLINCSDMARFLGGLLIRRAKNDCGYLSDLSELEISFNPNSPYPDDDVQVVQHFLETGPKLEKLILDVSRHALINRNAIIAQSNLKSLELGTGKLRPARSYAVEDVKAILSACHELTHIALNLPAVSLGSLIDLAHDFKLGRPQNCLTHVETEFEAMLTVLAQHAPLHTLRILNLPTFDKTERPHRPDSLNATEHRLARVLYQNYATEIMRFMAKRGTAPIVLDTRPTITYQLFDECLWPTYLFNKGQLRVKEKERANLWTFSDTKLLPLRLRHEYK